MLAVYLTCLIVGGVFVGLSVFSGLDKDMDVDVDVDVDVDADVDVDVDMDVGDVDSPSLMDASHGAEPRRAPKRRRRFNPLLSFRFWTFGTASFGLTGSTLTGLGLAGAVTTLAMSGALGVTVGFGSAWVVHVLRQSTGEAPATRADMRGQPGELLLPLRAGGTSKVRVMYRGRETDLLAVTEDGQDIPKGARVVVLQVDERGRAQVTPEDQLFLMEDR